MSANNPDRHKKLPGAETGNASNPSPASNSIEPAGNQVLDEKAEKYLRESANIEDYPDPQDQQDADQTFKREKGDQ
jgi:hypothetical protein